MENLDAQMFPAESDNEDVFQLHKNSPQMPNDTNSPPTKSKTDVKLEEKDTTFEIKAHFSAHHEDEPSVSRDATPNSEALTKTAR